MFASNQRPESDYDNNRESHYDDQYEVSQGHAYGDPNSHHHRASNNGIGGLTPPADTDDEHVSQESGSGGSSTKIGSPIESRPQSAYRHQFGESSEHSSSWRHDQHSDSSHDNSHTGLPGGGMYSTPSYNQSGYVDQPLYNNLNGNSPVSSHAHGFGGRHRQGSYTGSGLDSARASTIGTDHMHNNGINSSRVALNQEWRQSADLDSINIAPGKEGYTAYTPKDIVHPQPFQEKDGSTYVPIPPSSPAMGASMNEKQGGLGGADGVRQPEPAVVLARNNRMAWIDGLRGLASIVIFVHHYGDLTWSGPHPDVLQWGYPDSFIRCVLLLLSVPFWGHHPDIRFMLC